MIKRIDDQLTKIEGSDYSGPNGGALQEMDVQELRGFIERATDEHVERDFWVSCVREDVQELKDTIIESVGDIPNITESIANVTRHFKLK